MKRPGWMWAGNCAAFLLGITAACGALHALLPDPPVVGIHPKLLHLEENHRRYDTLFVGTSRTYHQVLPEHFDAATARLGPATRSFNAAIDGMFPPEDAYYLERIAQGQPRFRWVFLELNPIRLRIDDAKRGTERVIYWHDGRRLWLLLREACEYLRQPSNPAIWPARWSVLQSASERGEMFLRAQTNLGRGQIIGRYLQRSKSHGVVDHTVLGARRDGYLAVDYPPLHGDRGLAYERQLAARQASPAKPSFGTAASQAALADTVALIRTMGAEPVLIIPPTLAPRKFVPRDSHLPILDFTDVQRFPELYRPAHRADSEHLNAAGARIYTQLLAEEFARRASLPRPE